MARFPAVVAVDLARLAALHGDMTDLAAPVALDFLTAFLNVSKAATGVTLLLVGMVTVTGHVAGLATVVAHLLPLLLGFLAIPGDVATPAAVVACVLSPLTIPCNMSWFSTAIAEKIFPPATALATSTSSIWTVLDPVARAATTKTLVAAHSL